MAFYVRRYWPVAVVVSACSLLSYAPFLWNTTIVALPLVAFGEFLAVIATGLFFFAIVGRGSDKWLRPRTALNNPIPPSPVRSAPSTVLNGGPSFVGPD
jgi:hypothetical protein